MTILDQFKGSLSLETRKVSLQVDILGGSELSLGRSSFVLQMDRSVNPLRMALVSQKTPKQPFCAEGFKKHQASSRTHGFCAI